MSQVNGTKSGVTIRKRTKKQSQSTTETTNQTVTADQRQAMIQAAAYFRAEQRGFQGGDPAEDWFEAEREIDAMLNGDDHHTHTVTN